MNKRIKESVMDEEKLRILEMIKDGTVSPQEGLELINALVSAGAPATKESSPPVSFDPCCGSDEDAAGDQPKGRKPGWLHIKVDDQETGKKVDIRIPISLAKFAGRFIPKDARAEMKEKGIDFDLTGILEQLEKEGHHELVEVMEGDKKIVRIYTQ